MPDKLDPNLVSRVLASLGSPPAPFLGNLAEIFGPGLPPPPPPIIQARYFKNETIRIDGYTFERCRFDGCHLVTEWATFAFRECVLSPDCGLYFTGPALKVARLLMHALEVKRRIVRVAGDEALFAHVNPDGTFTLE